MSAAAPLQGSAQYLLELVFKEDASVKELLLIVVAWAVFWFAVFYVAAPALKRATYGKPWLRRMCEREYERYQDVIEKENPGKTREQIFHEWMEGWPWGQVMMLQHVVGAALCVPALMGMGDPSWASSLANLGLLSEMGWELEHTAECLYTRFFTEDGEKKMPNSGLVFLSLHHGLTLTMGLPMALYYRTLRALHWLVFDLQASGAMSPLVEYGKTLDVKDPKDLERFKLVNLVNLIFNVWTRFLHFVYLVATILMAWYRDKAWSIMAVGALPVLAFCGFNYIIVSGTYKRYKKFRNACAKVESLPADTPELKRRQSTATLVSAAAEFGDFDMFDAADVVASFLESLEDRPTIDRRKSMPPVRKGRPSWGANKKSVRMLQFSSAPADIWKQE